MPPFSPFFPTLQSYESPIGYSIVADTSTATL